MEDESRAIEPVVTDAADVAADQQADHAVNHALAEAVPVADLPDVEEEPPVEVEAAAEIPLIAEDAMNGAPGETLVLEKKHPLAIRWMHWINFPVLFTMIWSGLLIYWNDSDNAYQHPHEVYRIGIGKLTLFRFFPEWFYTNHMWDFATR